MGLIWGLTWIFPGLKRQMEREIWSRTLLLLSVNARIRKCRRCTFGCLRQVKTCIWTWHAYANYSPNGKTCWKLLYVSSLKSNLSSTRTMGSLQTHGSAQLRRRLRRTDCVWCDLYEVMAGKGSEVVFMALTRASPASSWHYRGVMRINVIPAPRCPAACTFCEFLWEECVCLRSGARAVDQMTASKSNHYDVPQEKNAGLQWLLFLCHLIFKKRRRHPLSTVPLKRQVMKGKESGWGLTVARTDTPWGSGFKWFALGSESKISAWLHPFGNVPKSPNDDDIIKDDVIQEFQTTPLAYFQNQKTFPNE